MQLICTPLPSLLPPPSSHLSFCDVYLYTCQYLYQHLRSIVPLSDGS
jgi:hypothetical protein